MTSAEWRERKISLAGIELPIVTAGSGRTLLVLHDEFGYPGWLNWQSALSRERTLIIPMAPGFGRAPRIEWTRALAIWDGYCQKEEGLNLTSFDPAAIFNHSLEDMDRRIRFLDHEGTESQLVYPTLGLFWEDES
jgi:hypothetical protein